MAIKIFHDQSPWKYGAGLGSNSQPLGQRLDLLLFVLQGPAAALVTFSMSFEIYLSFVKKTLLMWCLYTIL